MGGPLCRGHLEPRGRRGQRPRRRHGHDLGLRALPGPTLRAAARAHCTLRGPRNMAENGLILDVFGGFWMISAGFRTVFDGFWRLRSVPGPRLTPGTPRSHGAVAKPRRLSECPRRLGKPPVESKSLATPCFRGLRGPFRSCFKLRGALCGVANWQRWRAKRALSFFDLSELRGMWLTSAQCPNRGFWAVSSGFRGISTRFWVWRGTASWSWRPGWRASARRRGRWWWRRLFRERFTERFRDV